MKNINNKISRDTANQYNEEKEVIQVSDNSVGVEFNEYRNKMNNKPMAAPIIIEFA
jgi:hypothetical protein